MPSLYLLRRILDLFVQDYLREWSNRQLSNRQLSSRQLFFCVRSKRTPSLAVFFHWKSPCLTVNKKLSHFGQTQAVRPGYSLSLSLSFSFCLGERALGILYLPKPLRRRSHQSPSLNLFGCGSKPMGSHSGVGEFTTHFRTYFRGDWDVHYVLLTHGHLDSQNSEIGPYLCVCLFISKHCRLFSGPIPGVWVVNNSQHENLAGPQRRCATAAIPRSSFGLCLPTCFAEISAENDRTTPTRNYTSQNAEKNNTPQTQETKAGGHVLPISHHAFGEESMLHEKRQQLIKQNEMQRKKKPRAPFCRRF